MANFIPKIEFGSPTTTITFELPPEGDNLRERLRSDIKVTESTNGTIQSQFNFTEQVISPRFVFVSQSIIDQLRTFFTTHALLGEEFNYFEHSDESEFLTVTLDRHEYDPIRIIPNNTGGFVQDLEIRMRRTL